MDVICQIVRGEVAAHVVWSDEHTIAFLDHRPVFAGHVLVCPRDHVDDLVALDPDRIDGLFRAVQRVAAAMGPALGADGSFTAINTVVSQSVPHLHVHVVPRRRKDGLRGFFWPRQHYAPGQAEEVADRLRDVLVR